MVGRTEHLTDLDDSLRHQTSTTFDQVATTDHRFFDRYWYTLAAPDESLAIVTGIGAYSNMNVIDAYVVAVVDRSRQINLRFSRRLRPGLDRMGVGPLDYRTIEPHQTTALQLSGHPAIQMDINFTAVEPPRMEGAHQTLSEGHRTEDYRRYLQLGTCGGTVTIGDRSWELKDWFSARDHAWGVRQHVGGFAPVRAVDPIDDFSGLFVWLVFSSETYVGYLQIQENGDGTRRFLEGEVRVRANGTERTVAIVEANHNLKFAVNSNVFRNGTFDLVGADGSTFEVHARGAHEPFGMIGTGYFDGFDDGRGFGHYRGDDIVECDEYELLADGLVRFPDGRRGYPWHREQNALVQCNNVEGSGYVVILTEGIIERYGLNLPHRAPSGNGVTYVDE